MKGDPRFLTLEQVLAIHRRVIEEFGGDAAVRDYGLLDSAVTMPAARFQGRLLHEDLPSMAAAYLFHLCRNHPFVDGNKRSALGAAEVFLLVNGMRLAATNEELEEFALAVAAGKTTKDEVVRFFREHAVSGRDPQ